MELINNPDLGYIPATYKLIKLYLYISELYNKRHHAAERCIVVIKSLVTHLIATLSFVLLAAVTLDCPCVSTANVFAV